MAKSRFRLRASHPQLPARRALRQRFQVRQPRRLPSVQIYRPFRQVLRRLSRSQSCGVCDSGRKGGALECQVSCEPHPAGKNRHCAQSQSDGFLWMRPDPVNYLSPRVVPSPSDGEQVPPSALARDVSVGVLAGIARHSDIAGRICPIHGIVTGVDVCLLCMSQGWLESSGGW